LRRKVANTPGITLGSPYLLPSIAAVVIGGTTLGGGRSSVLATIGGAFFMTQLNSFALSLYAPIATQLVVEGAIIAAGMALYSVDFTGFASRITRWRAARNEISARGKPSRRVE
jgi:ribose transport system permease protein